METPKRCKNSVFRLFKNWITAINVVYIILFILFFFSFNSFNGTSSSSLSRVHLKYSIARCEPSSFFCARVIYNDRRKVWPIFFPFTSTLGGWRENEEGPEQVRLFKECISMSLRRPRAYRPFPSVLTTRKGSFARAITHARTHART